MGLRIGGGGTIGELGYDYEEYEGEGERIFGIEINETELVDC